MAFQQQCEQIPSKQMIRTSAQHSLLTECLPAIYTHIKSTAGTFSHTDGNVLPLILGLEWLPASRIGHCTHSDTRYGMDPFIRFKTKLTVSYIQWIFVSEHKSQFVHVEYGLFVTSGTILFPVEWVQKSTVTVPEGGG